MCVLVKGFPALFNEASNGRKSVSPFCLFLHLFLNFNSASQPLHLNMFLSHLSITSFQSIFICVASHSLSQSISVPRERWCVSRWVSPCLSLSFSLLFFSVWLPFAMWETLKGLCNELESLPWWPALTDSSYRGLFMAGPGEGMKECVCKIKRVCVCVFFGCPFTSEHVHTYMCECFLLSAHQCQRSSSSRFVFLVELLLWCLSQGHRQINQGRLNLNRAFYGSLSLLVYPVFPLNSKHTLILLHNPQKRDAEKDWLE